MKRSRAQHLLASALQIAQLPAASAALYQSVVQTSYGPIQGLAAFSNATAANISNWQNVGVWKGIPFAASTAGQNRWRPPQPRAAWNTTLVASSYGPGCPTTQGESATAGEDCLYLNIWSAANSTTDKLPVILWSHPAGGSSADALFDGGGMAAQNVVFVNYNYRDGVFGWLATPELSAEMGAANGNSSGNWGMLDQFAALKWVHANIAAFGGDPDRITTVGQSAGSAAAYHMVNSPLVKGLIVGAIAESGVRDPYDPLAASLAESYNNMTYSLSIGAAFLQANNATSIAQLRAIPLASLTDTSSQPGSGAGFRPTLDGYAVPDKYINTLLKIGPANDVPFMTGNTRDESGADFTLTSMNVSSYVAAMQAQYGNATFGNSSTSLAARALALYPAANASQAAMSYNAHWRDTSLVSSWKFALGWATKANSSMYTYYWDHAPPGQNQGAHHMSEINYVFNNLYRTDLPWTADDYAIAKTMSAYWANFAKTGNPNLGGSYDGDGNLTWWNSTPGSANSTAVMHVGDGWGDVPIAEPGQIQLILDYFSEQVPF
ncbi:putative carboxylesterase protein [Diplogelasinospora grovesii]|uniref:Carboxylesterase protein n=1 Tax=Diplogelasinospora grovesii TaxID=303347 RepID=A0AAN6N3X9_9PEZI|nr:putative carboxylesterase protein [Diplogelasinospora grovesii]